MTRIKLVFISIFIAFATQSAAVNFPNASFNVPYTNVTKLESLPPNHQISYGDDPLQYGMLWLAPKAKPELATIVLIHGGCWLNAFDIKHTYPLATGLAQQGYNVWSLEYRRTGDSGGGWPGSFEDIMHGIAQLEKMPSEIKLNPNIILMGHSAGGHLALLASATLNQWPLQHIDLKATIGLAAISNIKDYSKGNNSCQKATPQFMHGSYDENQSDYDQANPALKNLPKSTYLLHGTADSIVPINQAELAGTHQVIVEKAGHFDWIHPGSQAFERLKQQLQEINR
ncbi:alpha/beta hydrolase family protein [Aliikangiella sp. IMCC44632]